MKFGTALTLLLSSSLTSAAVDTDSTKPHLRSEAFFESIEDHPTSRRLMVGSCTGAQLNANEQLNEGEFLCAGDYYLGLVKGRLYIFQNDRFAPMTQLSRHPTPGAFVKMQGDGNLVIRDEEDGNALWDSMTNGATIGEDYAYLILDIYGTALVRRDNGSPTFFAAYTPGCLYDWTTRPNHSYVTSLQPNQRLFPGQYLCDNGNSNNYRPGQWRGTGFGFGMDNEGEFFGANGAGDGAAAGTAGVGWYAVMQNDGNLVVYDKNGDDIWASGTGGYDGATLQFDGGIATIVNADMNETIATVYTDGGAAGDLFNVTLQGSKKPTPMPTIRTPMPTNKPTPTPTDEIEMKMKQGNTFPATNGQTANMLSQFGVEPSNVVCGAIQAVLAHPTDENICFAGAVNGGVWRTFSCTAATPNWEPLTDDEESLSVGDMVFDKEDTSSNTILVAVGTRSSFAGVGGQAIGMLYTQNALDGKPAWQVLDNAGGEVNFRENKVKFLSAFARGDLMMAAAYTSSDFASCKHQGIFRSTDRGLTWTNVLKGTARAIASDPNDAERFYATLDRTNICDTTLPTNGVFTSADSGETWTPTSPIPTNDGTPWKKGELNNAKLSVSASGSRVWSALLRNGVADSISYSDNQGGSWTKMDTVLTPRSDGGNDGLNPREKPGGQGAIHFALLASPDNRNEVYVAGDRQDLFDFPNFIGATGFTGRLFRGDAGISANPAIIPSPQWEHMTNSNGIVETPEGGTNTNSGPHADGRDMEIRADGHLLEGDDGGIAVRTNPGSNDGDWFGVCGNMQAFESHGLAYEPVFGMVLFGNQDTGTIAGMLGQEGTYTSLLQADGNACMIDHKSDPLTEYFYFGTQNYGFFVRLPLNKSTGQFGTSTGLVLPRPGSFLSVAAMNPSDQTVFAVASPPDIDAGFFSAAIMLTLNRGDTFTVYETPFTREISAMVWATNGQILYVSNGLDVVSCMFGPPDLTCGTPVAVVGASFVRHLAVDPTDVNVVYGASVDSYFDLSSPAVFVTSDGGATWNDISVPGSILSKAALGGSVAVISQGPVSAVAVGTSNGILVPDGAVGTGWKLLASLPTVAVFNMVYEPQDDTLVVSTFGRGVWFLERASEVLTSGDANLNWEPAVQKPNAVDFASLVPETLLHVVVPPEDYYIPEDDIPNTYVTSAVDNDKKRSRGGPK